MNANKKRVAVVGAGSFGRNHLRVLSKLANIEVAAVCDSDPDRAAEAAREYGAAATTDYRELNGLDGAVIATPTSSHADIGCTLLAKGMDLMVEKPIAPDPASALRLIDAAERHGRILQVGHLERFNPAVAALKRITTIPLFFEIHRLSLFSPRGLDVDVVLDLMIHDLDIVLSLTQCAPEEVRAAGISILSEKVDIANVRLAFPGGCVANLTASRVSTERVRKLRLFQPGRYVSVDYARQELASFRILEDRQVMYDPVEVVKDEPLKLELESFAERMTTRERPVVDGRDALRALEAAHLILAKIEEHASIVRKSLSK